jgi:4'-phosphopantetheinyl transferase
LSRYTGLVPAEWRFANDDYGRPRVLNDSAFTQDLSFNVSHAGNLIVVAVARNRMLGVDIENVQERTAPIDLADRFFAQEETAALVQLPPEHRQRRFFEYWTLKESYIKARGMGLSIPLDQFSFDLSHPTTVDFAIIPSLGDLAARWRFWQFEPASEYLCAICFERREGEFPRLLAREIIPMSDERALPYVLCRASVSR